MKKVIALLLAFVLVIGATVAGTLAYLHATTDEVKNTFTMGSVSLTLNETEGVPQQDGSRQFKVTPGTPVTKDPVVTVGDDSENCWVFVKVTKTNWNEYLTYTIDSNWTELTGLGLPEGVNVYYHKDATAGWTSSVLANDTINVDGDLATLTAQPKMDFMAYAIQSDNLTTAAAAWAALNP